MSISELQYLVVDALEDVKAQDIRVFDTGPQRDAKSPALSDLFDRVVVATATPTARPARWPPTCRSVPVTRAIRWCRWKAKKPVNGCWSIWAT